MKEAVLYEKLENGYVHCYLCNHHCRIAEKKFGFCGVRENIGGILYTHAYGSIVAAHVDPVEKKPLYHFLPGTYSFSVATIGCNFRCGFCQNWEISQSNFAKSSAEAGGGDTAEQIVETALQNNCRSISYTYTEPTIFFEYAFDIAKFARRRSLYNIFVTNGYMTKEALEMIKPYLDAANVDLKFFKNDDYKSICQGSLQPVLDSIKIMKKMGVWVEVTTLVVPGKNDSKEDLLGIAEFISSIDKNIPWHVSRFHPDYKFSAYESTPESTLKNAQDLGQKAGLNFIYVGNVRGWGSDTYCATCKKPLIKREVFEILENNLEKGKCPFCDVPLPGVFQ